MSKKWEFHFRNFDNHENWFGVYHRGCGMAPWHERRPRCWDVELPHNPGGGHSSVYVPASFVVKGTQWVKLILDSIKEVGEIGLAIASEGEDLQGAISGALEVAKDVVEAVSHDVGHDLDELQKKMEESFQASCRAVGKSPAEVRGIARRMGLGSDFGFIAGKAFKTYIHDDNEETNDNGGFTFLRAPKAGRSRVDHKCTAAFMHRGGLILYWDSNDLHGFWSKF